MFRPYLNSIDKNKRILEIGPLTSPMIPKDQSMGNVFYADIRSTEDVKRFYKNDPNVDNSKIVDIDFVLKSTYKETFANVEKFDYFVASHVVEHIPCLISFFNDISCILNTGGKLLLTIPDKRYCFDHFRCPTSFAECYDVYTKKITNNPMRVLDLYSSATTNDPVYWWNNTDCNDHIPQIDDVFKNSIDLYNQALDGKYIDAHFSVFTPQTFLLLLYNMTCFCLLPFKCIEFYGTDQNTQEFNAVLEKDDQCLNDSDAKEKNKKVYLKFMDEVSEFEKNLNPLSQKIRAMENSKSWRLTKPLRQTVRIIRKITGR